MPEPPTTEPAEPTEHPTEGPDEVAEVEEPATDESPTDAPSTDDEPADEPGEEEPNGGSAGDDGAEQQGQDALDSLDGSTVLEDGDSGEAVGALQDRLDELGYWPGPVDGSYGSLTEQAVMAFQGWQGLTRDGRAGPETQAALQDVTPPEPDHAGDLIEVHRAEQVLLVVEDGRTALALHTSTGSGKRYTQPSGHEAVADTPVGDWEISWRVDGWRQSDLGRLYRPAYFHERGIAVHGYPEVPAHPASHGCVRVSIDAMDVLWDRGLVAEGTRVVVS